MQIKASILKSWCEYWLGKRLQVPDDYFTLSQAIGYQYYDLNNYYTGIPFGDGVSNNLYYTVAFHEQHLPTRFSH